RCRRNAGAAAARCSSAWPRPSTACPTVAGRWSGCAASSTCRSGKWPSSSGSARRPWKSTSPRECDWWPTISMAATAPCAPRPRQTRSRRPTGAGGPTEMDPRPEQIEATAAAWLARRDRADWCEEDDQTLADWLCSDTRHRVAYLRLRAAWDEAGRLEALGAGRHEAGPPPRGLWPAAVGDTATRPPHAP